jgi:hypothetical protein
MVLWKLKQKKTEEIIKILNNQILRSREYHMQYDIKVTIEHVKKAIKYNFKKDLRYNDAEGKTYRGKICVRKYEYLRKYKNIEETIQQEFSGIILNDARRLAENNKLT